MIDDTVSAGPIVPVNRGYTEPSKPLTKACNRYITSGISQNSTQPNPINNTTTPPHVKFQSMYHGNEL